MNRRYFLVILGLAAACLLLILILMWHGNKTRPPATNPKPFPTVPFGTYLYATGIVEASSGNIFLGAPTDRMVEQVNVKAGDSVKKGDVLFSMDTRDLQAELLIQQTAYENAFANFQKLKEFPRPEDLTIANAMLKSADVEAEQAKMQYEMVEGLQNRALSQEEVNRRNYNYQLAIAKLEQVQADFQKIKAGTWQPDLVIARLQALQAKAGLEKIQTEIDRMITRSPIDGTVLQVNILAGEFATPPAMIVGNIEELYVKVNINQYDAPYFRPESPAVGFLQGETRVEIPLEFVRLDPILVDKQTLSNDIREAIDTRVLPIVYRIKHKNIPIYVGQLMDVFIQGDIDP